MNIKDLKESVKLCIDSNLTPFIQGSPGLGKSAIVKEIAADRNLKLIDVRLSQCDITDLNGLPKTDGKKATFIPFDTFPVEGDELPEGKDGWLVFLDELNAAVRSVQCAAYKLILDRMVGTRSLHAKVAIVAAGNLMTDNAVVNSISTALRSRLVNLTLKCDANLWMDWGLKNHIDPRILAYIKYKPGNLFNFDPDKDEETYACPRTWDMLNKILNVIKTNDLEKHSELITGIVGNIGLEFITYAKLRDQLPDVQQIMQGTVKGSSSWDIGKKWMILFHIIHRISILKTPEELKNIFNFTDDLGAEFTALFIKQCSGISEIRSKLMASPELYNRIESMVS